MPMEYVMEVKAPDGFTVQEVTGLTREQGAALVMETLHYYMATVAPHPASASIQASGETAGGAPMVATVEGVATITLKPVRRPVEAPLHRAIPHHPAHPYARQWHPDMAAAFIAWVRESHGITWAAWKKGLAVQRPDAVDAFTLDALQDDTCPDEVYCWMADAYESNGRPEPVLFPTGVGVAILPQDEEAERNAK
jgi:hypothetical protein